MARWRALVVFAHMLHANIQMNNATHSNSSGRSHCFGGPRTHIGCL